MELTDPELRAIEATTFDELYAYLPALDCLGRCHIVSLGYTIPRARNVTVIRHDAILDRDEVLTWTCPALSTFRTCMVYHVWANRHGRRGTRSYAARPLICRLFGMAEIMECRHGCKPEGGLLPDRAVFVFLAQAARLDGDLVTHRATMTMATNPRLLATYIDKINHTNSVAGLNILMGNG